MVFNYQFAKLLYSINAFIVRIEQLRTAHFQPIAIVGK